MCDITKYDPKEARGYVKAALEDGWTGRVDGQSHLRLTKPGFRPITISHSPHGSHWFNRCRRDFQIAGVEEKK